MGESSTSSGNDYPKDIDEILESKQKDSPKQINNTWTEKFNPHITKILHEKKRETIASILSIGLLAIFILMILVGMGLPGWVGYTTCSSSLEFIKTTLSIVSSLLGVIFGFYFAKERL
jgi:hypothetical protein